jgi:DNA modification methylase
MLFGGEGLDARDDKAERQALRNALPGIEGAGRPVGSDDAIVAMSSPPLHTACPNPFLRDWLANLPRPVGDESRMDPGPFLDDVTGSKATLQYKAHSYPTKVPPEIIVRLLAHYTEPGDVVLDGFAGSGMTGVAAVMCANPPDELSTAIELDAKRAGREVRWGARNAILNDLAPNATFLASGVTMSVDPDAFDRASALLLDRFDEQYGWMYRTKTSDGREAIIDYTVWSEVFTCPHCGGPVVFYDEAYIPATGKVRDDFPCPSCGATVRKKGEGKLERRMTSVRLVTGDVIERIEFRPVRIHFRFRDFKKWSTGDKEPDAEDISVSARVAQQSVTGAPTAPLPINEMAHGSRLAPKGFTSVHHLYPDRSLIALTTLWAWANAEPDPDLRRALKFWVEQAFWGMAWMNRYRPDGFSQVSQYQSGVYYISSMHSECSLRYNLEGSSASRGKRATLVKLWKQVPESGHVAISTGDAARLPLPDACIDYIFVDPPFGENIPYADLAMVIDAWHGVSTHVDEEAIIDGRRDKSTDTYGDLITSCFHEFARVLKPGRWMTVEFSNSSNEVWAALQQALADAGFVIADTRVLDKSQDSYRQVTAANAVKHDLMISCYKPDPSIASQVASGRGSETSLWAFVTEHLRHLSVTEGKLGKAHLIRERLPDRIYDRVVAYFVSSGAAVPVTVAQFNDGLPAHFPERDSMFFLPDQAQVYERFRVTFKELDVSQFLITDEKSAVAWLRQQLKRKPAAMAEVQPGFLTELASGGAEWSELPDLLVLLEQNFVTADAGKWTVPDPKKAEHLEQLRTRELLRVFESYTSGTGTLARFRGDAIAAGFKRAWDQQEYATIARVGARIPREVLVDMPGPLAYLRNAQTRLGQ